MNKKQKTWTSKYASWMKRHTRIAAVVGIGIVLLTILVEAADLSRADKK